MVTSALRAQVHIFRADKTSGYYDDVRNRRTIKNQSLRLSVFYPPLALSNRNPRGFKTYEAFKCKLCDENYQLLLFSPMSPTTYITVRTASQHNRVSVTYCLCSHQDCMQRSCWQPLQNLNFLPPRFVPVRGEVWDSVAKTYLLPLKEEQKMKNVFQEKKMYRETEISLTDINRRRPI